MSISFHIFAFGFMSTTTLFHNHSAKQGSQSNEDEGKPGGGMGQREAEKTKKRDRR